MARWFQSECGSIEWLAPEFLDGKLDAPNRARVDRHVRACSRCASRFEQWSSVRSELRALAPKPVPDSLRTRLRAVASQEHARRHSPPLWTLFRMRLRLAVDNLMRPLVIPFAGGVSAAAIIIGSLTPSLMTPRFAGNDVATPIYAEATVSQVPGRMSPDDLGEDALLVEVSIDAQGRVSDVSVPEGTLTNELANEILFTTYVPAKMFGQPTTGKLLLRRSRITVKG